MKILLKINSIPIVVIILLNLFSVYFYYSILKEERIRMESLLKNDRGMFARMSGISDKEYSEDILGNEIRKKSLELEENNKNNLWNRFLEANDMINGEFMLLALEHNKDPEIAKKIVTEKNIEKYKETNPEFFKKVTKNGKTELVLLSGWANNRNMYQTANKENKQYHATESMNFIFDNMDDKQKDAIKIALNKDKNNAMTSGFIQMDKVFRSNSNDYGMIQNFINSYGSKGKELVYRLMTEDPTTDTLKSYVKDTETSEMIQKVTGLSGEEFLRQLRAFSSQAEKGLKSRGSAFKNQNDMIKVGKRDEKGNFTGNVTRLPLWTPYDDDINFEEEKKKLEDDKNRLNAMLYWTLT